MKVKRKRRGLGMLTTAAALSCILLGAATGAAAIEKTQGFYNDEATEIELVARYDAGMSDEDGGVTEIVAYNADNECFYVVNGVTGELDIVSMSGLTGAEDGVVELGSVFSLDLQDMADPSNPFGSRGKMAAHRNGDMAGSHHMARFNLRDAIRAEIKGRPGHYREFSGFQYGDLTSVAVSTEKGLVAVALQDERTNHDGLVALLDYDGRIKNIVRVGKQPDMICFSDSGNLLLVANEGEPREGYTDEDPDPMGTVTVINLTHGCELLGKRDVTEVDFRAFDGEPARSELVAAGVILKKETKPSRDLEPEYIVIDSSETYAYVALQEANAIAVLDFEALEFTGVYGLGFKDHSLEGNELDLVKDKAINIQSEDVYGIYMPDGISLYEVEGEDGAITTYLLTANEGDGREWGDYTNENKVDDVVYFDTTDYDGLFEEGASYIFGGRSFSIFSVTEDGLAMVYDSGSDFETITAEMLPEYFNSSNSKVKLDNRSGKKGPEPENVVVGAVGESTYAFIALERIGGIMVYDITDPEASTFVNYINSRDFSDDIAGDVAPEGLCFISEEDSVTGNPMLLSANEVSGTVSAYALYGTYYNITMAPGGDISSLNFNWYADESDEYSVTGLQIMGGAGEILDITDGVDDVTSESSGGGSAGPPPGMMASAEEASEEETASEDASSAIYHKARVEGLEPGATYAYRILGEGICSRWYTFTTDDGDDSFSFVFLADAQIGASRDVDSDTEGWIKTVEVITATLPDAAFYLHAGDQVEDASTKSQYDGFLSPEALTGMPVAALPGNHEVSRGDGLSDAFGYHFNMPNTISTITTISDDGTATETDTGTLNYWFTWNNVLVIALDNSGSASADEDTAAVFEKTITAAKDAHPDARWVIVSFHKSLYSVGRHTWKEGDIAAWKELMTPIMDAHGVDIVMAGHDHVYVRSLPLYADADASDNEDERGTVYFTGNSASGSKHYSPDDSLTDEEKAAYIAKYSQNNLPSFVTVQVDGAEMTLEAYEIGDDAIEMVDTYTMTK